MLYGCYRCVPLPERVGHQQCTGCYTCSNGNCIYDPRKCPNPPPSSSSSSPSQPSQEPSTCGNGICETGEDCDNCLQDCGVFTREYDECCTTGIARHVKEYKDRNSGKFCYSTGPCDIQCNTTGDPCNVDTGTCRYFRCNYNGICEQNVDEGPDCSDCAATTTSSYCGDSLCDIAAGESCSTCSQDCGCCCAYTPPDAYISRTTINTYTCKNSTPFNNYTYFSTTYPNIVNRYPTPSTTYFSTFTQDLMCPESQKNRPVEFILETKCSPGRACDCSSIPCSQGVLQIRASSTVSTVNETFVASSTNNLSSPQTFKTIYVFNKPVDYKINFMILNKRGGTYNDRNTKNNSTSTNLHIYDYYCYYGFCTRAQTNPLLPQIYKNLRFFVVDPICRFWKNTEGICRAQYGF